MQFNITTGYAVRLLICLGEEGEIMPGGQIAQRAGIPPKYLIKINSRLKKAGLIESVAGKKGGYYLCRRLEDITFLEVIYIMEPEGRISRCLEEEGICSMKAEKKCAIRKYYRDMYEDMKEKWLKCSLEEIRTWREEGRERTEWKRKEEKNKGVIYIKGERPLLLGLAAAAAAAGPKARRCWRLQEVLWKWDRLYLLQKQKSFAIR